MTTLDLAKRKWARKMADAGAKWKAAVTGKVDEYAAGLSAMGLSVGPLTKGAYSKGVESVTATDFQSAVSGKEDKWARRFAEAIAR